MDEATGTFWDHLEELRNCLLRIVGITVAVGVVAFACKGLLFDIVLAPTRSDFIVYRLVGAEAFSLHLINTGLTEQLMMHMKTALYMGLLLASPYVTFELFHFISPALYRQERRYTIKATGSAYLLFIIGTVVNYFLIFPFTLRFLGTYQVNTDVTNMLTLQSYVDTLINMSLMMALFAMFTLCFTACSSDDDDKPAAPTITIKEANIEEGDIVCVSPWRWYRSPSGGSSNSASALWRSRSARRQPPLPQNKEYTEQILKTALKC